MTNKAKKIIAIAVLIVGIIGVTYAVKPWNRQSVNYKPGVYQNSTDAKLRGQPVVLNDYVYYPGKEGQNALEILEKTTKAETKKYDFGTMVVSINGVKPDDKHFWKLYYNGEEAQVGADQLITHDGDAVEWVLDAIHE